MVNDLGCIGHLKSLRDIPERARNIGLFMTLVLLVGLIVAWIGWIMVVKGKDKK